MCLACAIPVRGRTLGAECLSAALGEDAPVFDVAEREPGAAARTVAGAAYALAVVASLLPWSRFGAGTETFGAWSGEPRWSLVPAAAAIAGLLISVARALARRRGAAWDLASVAAGALVAIGSVLALVRPPAFTSPWLGPWVALGIGLVAIAASTVALQQARERDAVHV
jgi:hypothetical protein